MPQGLVTTSYEVQIFREKRWRIDSMFDDRALALFEAKRMNESGRYVCVRVVEETFDQASGNTKLSTIYRGGRIEQAHQKDIEDAIKMRRDIRLQEGAAAEKEEQARQSDGRNSRLILWAGIGVGMFGMVGGIAVVLLLK